MGNDIVRDHDRLNGMFRGCVHNKCNLQAKNTFVPIYAFNSTNYDNDLFITKLAKKIRLKVLTKTDENYISIDMGYAKALDMIRFLHPLSLDAISKTLSDKECVTLNKFGLEGRKGIFPYEWFDSIDKLHETKLSPKVEFYSKLKHSGITDKETHNITEGYCNICNTRYNNKNEHNESDEHNKNVKQKKLVDKKWRDKVNELGLDHNMKYNQIMITSSNY